MLSFSMLATPGLRKQVVEQILTGVEVKQIQGMLEFQNKIDEEVNADMEYGFCTQENLKTFLD